MNFYEQGKQNYLLSLVYKRREKKVVAIIAIFLMPYQYSKDSALMTCELFLKMYMSGFWAINI